MDMGLVVKEDLEPTGPFNLPELFFFLIYIWKVFTQGTQSSPLPIVLQQASFTHLLPTQYLEVWLCFVIPG